MKNDRKVTVATVTYNASAFLEQTIKSVTSQSYQNIEYVIIDGASKDNTLAIAQHYADQYSFIKIKSEPDKGIYDAMNKAQQMATGDFLIFLGADDVFYHTDIISNFTKLITDINAVYYGDVLAKDTREIWYGPFTTEKIIMQNICHQSIFYPKHIYKTLAYDVKYKLFADWDYNLRVWSKHGPFIRMEFIVVLFAEHGASISQDPIFLKDKTRLVKQYFGSRYLWLLKMQKAKQRLLGKTDLRKVKGFLFHKLK